MYRNDPTRQGRFRKCHNKRACLTCLGCHQFFTCFLFSNKSHYLRSLLQCGLLVERRCSKTTLPFAYIHRNVLKGYLQCVLSLRFNTMLLLKGRLFLDYLYEVLYSDCKLISSLLVH